MEGSTTPALSVLPIVYFGCKIYDLSFLWIKDDGGQKSALDTTRFGRPFLEHIGTCGMQLNG
eukprot:scaffold8706_cov95-Cylindrotheca_fusiformis.AAC.2